GLQAEHGAAIVEQVELDVATPAELLKRAVPVRVRLPAAAFHDRAIRRQEAIPAVADKREGRGVVAFEIFEKGPADAARLAAMVQKEILIAPLLETLIVGNRGVASAHRLPGAVEVDDVIAPRVIRRQVGAAAEPPLVALGKEPEIGVDGGHHGAARV